jgi:alkylation response protein AidB-like acyl-CoA dehydrogenase
MSNLGQNFAGQYGQNLMAGGQAAAQGMLGAGSARGSAYIGGANALTGALGQYLNYNQNQQLMNRLLPGGGGGGYTYGAELPYVGPQLPPGGG